MTAAVWQSREALEERIGPDFVEIGSSGALDRESLIALILGSDPGVWAAEDFAVRELAPTDPPLAVKRGFSRCHLRARRA